MADIGMSVELPLVMVDSGLGNWADCIIRLALGRGVIGWENGCSGAYHGAHIVVHFLALCLIDQFVLDNWTGIGIVKVVLGSNTGMRDRRVLVKIVVVVCRGADDRARLARLAEVNVWVRRRECRVGRADDGAVECGSHFE